MMFIPNQFYYPCYAINTYQPAYQFNQMSLLSNGSAQRSRFTKEEDDILRKLADQQTDPNWNEIARHLKNRSGRQCRERYNNYLRPNLVNGAWTHEEEELLLSLYERYGPKWSLISQSFKSRSPVNIKNHHSSLVNQSAIKVRINRITESRNDTDTDAIASSSENDFETSPSSKQEENKNDKYIDKMFSGLDASNEELWLSNFPAGIDSNVLAF